MSSTQAPTWRNVDGSSMLQAASQLGNAYNNYARDIANFGNALSGFGQTIAGREQAQLDQAKEANTQDFIARLNQAQSLDDINRLRATGALDPNFVKTATGGLIDQKQVNSALANWNADTYSRASNADNLLGFSEAGKQVQGEIQSLISQGRFQEAGSLLAQNQDKLPQSVITSLGKTVSDAQYNWGNLQVNQQTANTNTGKTIAEINQESAKQQALALEANKVIEARKAVVIDSYNMSNPDKPFESLSSDEQLQLLQSDPTIIQKMGEYNSAMGQVASLEQSKTTMAGTVGSPNYSGALSNTGSNNARAIVQAKLAETAQVAGVNPDSLIGLIQTESNYDANAKNGKSTATGIGQFLEGTWGSYASKYNLPQIQKDAKGNIVYDPRRDPELSMKALGYMVRDLSTSPTKNKALQAGLNEATYVKAGMFFGTGGISQVINAYIKNPDIPIASLVDKKVMKANPNLVGKTVGQVLSDFNTSTSEAIKSQQINRGYSNSVDPYQLLGIQPTSNSTNTNTSNNNSNSTQEKATGSDTQASTQSKEAKAQTIQEALNTKYTKLGSKSQLVTNEDGSINWDKTIESVELDTNAIKKDIERLNQSSLTKTASSFIDQATKNGAVFEEVFKILNKHPTSNLSDDEITKYEQDNANNPDALKAMAYYKANFKSLSRGEKESIKTIIENVNAEITVAGEIEKGNVLNGLINDYAKKQNSNYTITRGATSLMSPEVFEKGTSIKLPSQSKPLNFTATTTFSNLNDNDKNNIIEYLSNKGGYFWDNGSLQSAFKKAVEQDVPVAQVVKLMENAIEADKYFNGGDGTDLRGWAWLFTSQKDIITAVENAVDGLILINNDQGREAIGNSLDAISTTQNTLNNSSEFKAQLLNQYFKDSRAGNGKVNKDTWAKEFIHGKENVRSREYLTKKQRDVSKEAQKFSDSVFGSSIDKKSKTDSIIGFKITSNKNNKNNPYVKSSTKDKLVLTEKGRKELQSLIENAEYSPKAREFLAQMKKLQDSGTIIE